MAARVVGFGRSVVFVRTVGATCIGDTYYAANTIPNILFETVAGGALASAVVPLLAGPVAAGKDDEAGRTASALLTWAVVALVPVALVGALLAAPIMRVLAGATGPAYDRQQVVALGARMLVVFMPQVVLYGIGVAATGVLHAHRRFLGPALAPLLSSLVVIVAYLLYAGEGTRLASCGSLGRSRELTLSIGTTLGVLALSGSLLVPLRRTAVRLRPTLRMPPGAARRFGRLAGAGVAALAAQQIALAVVLRLTYAGPAGTLVLYNLAWTVFLLPWAVLAVPIATTSFPELVRALDSGDEPAYARASARATCGVFAVSVAAAAALAAASEPVARLLVLHTAGHPDPGRLAGALVALAPGLVGYGLAAQLTRALYARHHGGRAAVAVVAGWVAVIGADLSLVRALPTDRTLLALTIGLSAGLVLAAVLLVTAVWRTSGGGALAGLARVAAAGLAAATAGGALGWLAERALPGRDVWSGLWHTPIAALVAVAPVAVAVAIADRELLSRRRPA